MTKLSNNINKIENSNINVLNQNNIEKQINITNNYNLGDDLNRFFDMKYSHKLYPYYIADVKRMKDGNYTIYSKSNHEDSKLLYPINYRGSFKVTDKRYKDIKNPTELIDKIAYSDTPVEITSFNIKQYLGDIIDPYPDKSLFSQNDKVLKSYLIPPKKILPDFKIMVDIKFKNKGYKISNIEFKLVNQLSSYEVVLNNYHQLDSLIFLELIINFKDKTNSKITYKINDNYSSDSRYIKEFNAFVLNMLKYKFYLYDINKKKIILSGSFNDISKDIKINNTSMYLDIINKIIII